MARILNYPKVQQVNEKEWELLEELEYHVGNENSTDIIKVPKGFITDFASVPRFLWWLFPPTGKYSPAAVIHDYIYTYMVYSRAKCDDIFDEAMKVMGVNWLTRKTMYRSVQIFGASSYGK